MYSRYYGRGTTSGKIAYNTVKRIYIKEEKLSLLSKMVGDEEVTFYSFLNKVKSHLKKILDDPMSKDVDSFFTDKNISREKLMTKLLDRGVIVKKEGFKEEEDGYGKKRSMHTVKYSVPRKDFERKIHRLYNELFESRINECDAGGAMGGGGGAIGGGDAGGGGFDGGLSAGANNAFGVGGQFVMPLFGMMRRKVYSPKGNGRKKKRRKKNHSKKK